MRADVTAYCRRERPGCAILNELAVGGCRADLAMIEKRTVTLFELKSKRDKLDRAADQMSAFRKHSHQAILVVDEKFFDRSPYTNGSPRCAWSHEGTRSSDVWCYPEPPTDADIGNGGMYRWRLDNHFNHISEPHATPFLHLMWRDEMIAEAKRHKISFKPKANMWDISRAMAWSMTGQQIAEAVCRQLANRARWYESGGAQSYRPA